MVSGIGQKLCTPACILAARRRRCLGLLLLLLILLLLILLLPLLSRRLLSNALRRNRQVGRERQSDARNEQVARGECAVGKCLR